MKTLIIAEKPSVATDIARVLGGMKKTADYYEGADYVVANALGHLLELACPEKYEVKRGKWTFAHLPVLPPTFDLKPIARSGEKLKNLQKLIRRKDIDLIVNACDAGREGELIFRYIIQATKAKQPLKRLWLQSMTPGAIKEAFENLRSDEEMHSLAEAAKSRSEADWLVGINGTRAMTAFNSLDGGFFLTTVGRVQTPTLTIVVRRENEIRQFKPKDYWEVHADFALSNGSYVGRWFDPWFKKNAAAPELKAERVFDRDLAERIVERCQGQTGSVSETSKRSTTISPQLFDLTSLQREANTKFGFSAKTTLSIAQALYEKHKVLTYPRTDSRALPEDYLSTVQETLSMLEGVDRYAPFAQTILQKQWVRPNKRVFDNSKISDHFAIIPTLQLPKSVLSEAEAKVYDLVIKRFLSVFYPAAEFDVTTRITTVGEDHFKTEGKVLVSAGWMAIYGKTEETEGSLIPLNGASQAQVEAVRSQAFQTKPPARFTEATLLSAMEGAGKLVEESELRDAMSEKGLGTPATRASIIENLIDQNYMQREGRDLRPTAKATQLLALIKGLGIEALSDPKLTGEWEYKLAQMEKGLLSRDSFMQEIRDMTTRIVASAKHYEGNTVPVENPAHLTHRCPKCGGEIVENYRRYACTTEGCDFSLPKHPGGRTFEVDEVEELLGKGQIGPLTGFISKMGRPFAASMRINDEYRLEFDFGESKEDSAEEQDLSALEHIGTCPKCGGRLLEGPTTYFCENTVGKRTCDFRSGRVILQQPIERAQMVKILTEGRSDLLTQFVSNRNHRQFKAFLVLDPKTHKLGFEFPPREAKTTKTKK
ncbi:MAG: DNA topoisomerase III [Duodenibacillus sp.]|nr:DNA topoisomerase III [Duodenibacillus sp.]